MVEKSKLSEFEGANKFGVRRSERANEANLEATRNAGGTGQQISMCGANLNSLAVIVSPGAGHFVHRINLYSPRDCSTGQRSKPMASGGRRPAPSAPNLKMQSTACPVLQRPDPSSSSSTLAPPNPVCCMSAENCCDIPLIACADEHCQQGEMLDDYCEDCVDHETCQVPGCTLSCDECCDSTDCPDLHYSSSTHVIPA